MTLILMDTPSVLDNPTSAHLCDVLLEALQIFVNTADDIKALCDELRTLRKFLDLIDRVFKAKPPRMAFEEQHFTRVEVLLDRCRATLSQLREILAAQGPKSHQATTQDSLAKVLRILQSPDMMVPRARINFYIQTLQMSLQTVKL